MKISLLIISILLFIVTGQISAQAVSGSTIEIIGSSDSMKLSHQFRKQKTKYVQSMTPTTIHCAEMDFDFGFVTEGDVAEHSFQLINSGSEMLLIDTIRGSSCCVTASYPTNPIPSGSQFQVDVLLDTRGKLGKHYKTITITANTNPRPYRLTVIADVRAIRTDSSSLDYSKFTNIKQTPVTTQTTTLQFDDLQYDFGTVSEGDTVMHVFTFTNTGAYPLQFTAANSSCGCVIPMFPKELIQPGAQGKIVAEFYTIGKTFNQSKTIHVFANTNPPTTRLDISAFVTPASE